MWASIWTLLAVLSMAAPSCVGERLHDRHGGQPSDGKRAVDVAHWLPNMPRGHEDPLRGGVRVTNAEGMAG
jgi:hypothetical protein